MSSFRTIAFGAVSCGFSACQSVGHGGTGASQQSRRDHAAQKAIDRLLASTLPPGRPKVPAGEQGYFFCPRCQACYAPDFGSSYSPKARYCHHQWVRIDSKIQFVRLLERYHPLAVVDQRFTFPHSPFWDDPKVIRELSRH